MNAIAAQTRRISRKFLRADIRVLEESRLRCLFLEGATISLDTLTSRTESILPYTCLLDWRMILTSPNAISKYKHKLLK